MSNLHSILPKVETTVFDRCTGKLYPLIEKDIPDNWLKVHEDKFIHVYKTADKGYTAILATDHDMFIRFCDVKRLMSDGKYHSIYLYNGLFDSVRTYKDIKSHMDIMKKLEHEYKKPCSVSMLYDFKVACRAVYGKNTHDPLSVPVANDEKAWRTIYSNNWGDCTDFIIIPDQWGNLWGTDDEGQIWDDIEQFVYDTVGYRSGYDFPSGKMITLRWGFHRVLCGVAVWHDRGIDW